MSKHTPGPWRILEVIPWNDGGAMWVSTPEGHDGIKSSTDTARYIGIRSTTEHMADIFGSTEGGHIASVPMTYDGRDQALANARLLAAAPDLYDACIAALDALSELIGADYDVSGEQAKLRAALDKAKGAA
jgi:hypothetical protein